jgi:hypothetical protein
VDLFYRTNTSYPLSRVVRCQPCFTPDREVKLTRDELLKGKDSQLEAAIQHIRALKK